jgi:hypothetical protein
MAASYRAHSVSICLGLPNMQELEEKASSG